VNAPVRLLAVGDAAVSVELGDADDPAANPRVRALDRALADSPLPGQIETVPGHRSLMVVYDPGVLRWAALRDALQERAAFAGADASEQGPLRTIPTRYGGDDGPDLAAVATRLGLDANELVRLHSASEYTALMLGFMPGFAYLGTLDVKLRTARLETPRVRVPAGSVAIAGRQTAVYPTTSPGGWNLLGHTSLRLFDPWRDPPALILPGDRVRFVPSGERPPAATPSPVPAPEGAATLDVLQPGLVTTVQDLGRRGLRRLGVSGAGALDRPAARAANELLGNDPGDALLECTLAGPRLRFLSATHFAVTGADLGAVLERDDLGSWPVPLGVRVFARAGNELCFRERRWGCRAYVALAGGVAVPVVLGSRSTDLGSGFGGHGGRALRSGDRLAVGAAARAAPVGKWERPPPTPGPVTLRVVLGPQDDGIEPASRARFFSESYAVGAASNRVGCRLAGTRLVHRGAPEIPSEGMVPGSIQVPPDGQPIVMLADGPTTGGYPKLATVVSADLPRLAQLVPGSDSVRFETVSVDEAHRIAAVAGAERRA
jgi:antagonist of KipI